MKLKAVAMSILAAMIGIQNDKNRERDFSDGNPVHFIIGGILFVAIFVACVLGLVKLILL